MTAAITAFERALGDVVSGELEHYADRFAPDAIVEWPFAPAGLPRRLEGRDAIATFVRASVARGRNAGRRRTGPHELALYPAGPDRVVAEFAIDVHTDGAPPRRTAYVHVVTVDAAGQITALRDYYGAATARLALPTETQARQLYATLDRAVPAGAWDEVEAVVAPDLEVRFGDGPPGGLAAWRARLAALYAAFAGGHHVIDEVIVDGERAVTRCRFVGTQIAEVAGRAPTGQPTELTVVHIDRFEHGRLRDHLGIHATR